MSNDDINNNVQPYQQILEKDLWDDITKKFMLADRQVSSKILPPLADNPYEFKLLPQGTRDGFTENSFWSLCAKQTHLVVIIKVNATEEILGGSNPIGWDKPVKKDFCKRCKDSFIFSLRNGTIQNSILSRAKDPE
ncbi:hypothetical protein C2G38_2176057 [Gigaspora rosea]|uniref:TLDc domain-containing protein n=1 Tax=Gigaspora rosea TaxID=44941 RepID=A0A397VGL4_9GLOM|nr:hypothetical protein C2G38_2176057 [Gigaspora rosea]